MSNQVIEFQEIEPDIVQITMQDKNHKNTFTRQLVKELINSFKMIADNNTYKAVILTGYDSYFSSGGTKQDLLSLHEGKAKFSDVNLYSLSLDCPIPVISAMQGHGIGGGFVLGLFADFVILSEESIYTANFMKYGFTPGMGGTLIIPRKLGLLGEEMMMLAKTYRGEELERRGIPFPVYPRDQVLTQALELARELAEKPRGSLITLKDHLVESLRKDLPIIIEKEVSMHGKTFHQNEVKGNIKRLFGA